MYRKRNIEKPALSEAILWQICFRIAYSAVPLHKTWSYMTEIRLAKSYEWGENASSAQVGFRIKALYADEKLIDRVSSPKNGKHRRSTNTSDPKWEYNSKEHRLSTLHLPTTHNIEHGLPVDSRYCPINNNCVIESKYSICQLWF